MFTGIVECMGTIERVEDLEGTRRFRVRAPEIAGELAEGASVAVDGACLTIVAVEGGAFAVDLIRPTLARTVAGAYVEGSRVNLERALRVGERLDGHIVQGHVDTVGHLRSSDMQGEGWSMDFEVPSEVLDATIEHGSITLNGVSLTVSEFPGPGLCRIGIIPHTHAHTNLGTLEPGDAVNVEGDVIGKYVARLMTGREDHR